MVAPPAFATCLCDLPPSNMPDRLPPLTATASEFLKLEHSTPLRPTTHTTQGQGYGYATQVAMQSL